MNKPDLIEHIAASTADFEREDIRLAVDVILSGITDSLNRGERVGRNPKTGEAVSIPERYVPYFRPGKELRESVDDHDLSV